MKVTYLGHSGFLLETADANFLFDYYEGEIPKLDQELPLTVFVSHKHGDHYNPAIFELALHYPRVLFVLSFDVPVKRQLAAYEERGVQLAACMLRVRKNTVQELLLSNEKRLCLETFASTDAGVAFWLTYEGQSYYHAGDLNLWVWEGESPQYNENMKRAYFRQLEKMKGRKLRLAFVPLDPRQGKDAFLGLESFLSYTESETVFPMHFWNDFTITDRFLEKHPEERGRIMRISKAGQEFDSQFDFPAGRDYNEKLNDKIVQKRGL